MNPAPGRRSFLVPFLAFTIFLVLGMALVSGAGAGEVVTLLKPDLRTRPPIPAKTIDTHTKDGTRLLRFSNEILNKGAGPLELEPKAEDCDDDGDFTDDRAAYQRVYLDSEVTKSPGTFLRETTQGAADGDTFEDPEDPVGCSIFHPAHNHWHFSDFAEYILRPISAANEPPVVGTGDKISFCLVDTNRPRPDLSGSPTTPFYGRAPFQCDADNVSGISVGWSDVYTASLADQWVDIGPAQGGLPNGQYCLTSIADPLDRLDESNEDNNARSIRIRLKGPGGSEAKIATRRTCEVVAPSS